MTIWLIVSVNSYFFHQKSLIDWKAVFMIGPGTALGSYTSARLSPYIPERHLRVIFVTVIAVLVWKTLWSLSVPRKKVGWPLGSTLGVSIGGISGVTGIGSGMILSPLLLNWGGLKNSHLSPTANAIMVFTTLCGALAFFEIPGDNIMRFGFIHMEKVLILFISAIICAHFGRKYQAKVSAYWRRFILGGLLLILAAQMLFSLW